MLRIMFVSTESLKLQYKMSTRNIKDWNVICEILCVY